mgnify:CR=1 FL=1
MITGGMKQDAHAIHNELDVQKDMLEELHWGIDKTQEKMVKIDSKLR